MINPTEITGSIALDTQSVDALRQSAKQNTPEGLKTVAKQFEALFMNMMLKSMREASSQDGPFDNAQSRMYTSMLDQKLSQNLASRGIGLADVLIRQLSNTVTAPPGANPAEQTAAPNQPVMPSSVAPSSVAPTVNKADSNQPAHVQAFQARLESHAEEASRTTGIPAKFMLGQAALESGWGRREIVAADGTPSHNLF
ncbi:MAG: rod-binding protein, partial [Sulfuriferula sp.]